MPAQLSRSWRSITGTRPLPLKTDVRAVTCGFADEWRQAENGLPAGRVAVAVFAEVDMDLQVPICSCQGLKEGGIAPLAGSPLMPVIALTLGGRLPRPAGVRGPSGDVRRV